MVKLLKKLMLEFGNEFYNSKKVITIGKYDIEADREIYYLSEVYGEKRIGKKWRIKKAKFDELKSQARNVQVIKTY